MLKGSVLRFWFADQQVLKSLILGRTTAFWIELTSLNAPDGEGPAFLGKSKSRTCPVLCLSISFCLTGILPIYCLSVCLCLAGNLPVCTSLSLCLSVCLTKSLSVHCLPAYYAVCLSVCLSLHCLPICMCLSVCLSVHCLPICSLSVCLFVSPAYSPSV